MRPRLLLLPLQLLFQRLPLRQLFLELAPKIRARSQCGFRNRGPNLLVNLV